MRNMPMTGGFLQQVPDANLVFEADVLLSEEPAQVVAWRKVCMPHPLVTA